MSGAGPTPCFWFDGQAEAAVRFWTGLLPDSGITAIARAPGAPADGPALYIAFTLMGRPFAALNGGPNFKLGEAVSLIVPCASQAEVDRLWDALGAEGGQPMDCGWIKDRFGQAWQIVPARMLEILREGESAGRARAFAAMMTMQKFDLAAIERAYAGEAVA
jgi:predicted 3-demethylubiquinone-9 3-methyltransferase (glyoxalase superfamily)